jgi:hypothetical protein
MKWWRAREYDAACLALFVTGFTTSWSEMLAHFSTTEGAIIYTPRYISFEQLYL